MKRSDLPDPADLSGTPPGGRRGENPARGGAAARFQVPIVTLHWRRYLQETKLTEGVPPPRDSAREIRPRSETAASPMVIVAP